MIIALLALCLLDILHPTVLRVLVLVFAFSHALIGMNMSAYKAGCQQCALPWDDVRDMFWHADKFWRWGRVSES